MSNKNSLWKWAAAYFIGAGAILAANPDCNMDFKIPGESKPKLEEMVELKKIKPKPAESDVLPPIGCKEYIDILVDLNQKIGDERETLTEHDLPHLLASSKIGNTKINQYLRFLKPVEFYPDAKSQTVRSDGKDNFFFVKYTNLILNYELEFEEGIVSRVDAAGNLTDLVGQSINILGHECKVVHAVVQDFFYNIDLIFVAEDFEIRFGYLARVEPNKPNPGNIVDNITHQRLKDGRVEVQKLNCYYSANKDISVYKGESLRQKADSNRLPGLKLDITYAGQTENKKHVVRVYERE